RIYFRHLPICHFLGACKLKNEIWGALGKDDLVSQWILGWRRGGVEANGHWSWGMVHFLAMSKTPHLTIIVPAYNAAKDLPACLESLYAQTVAIRILIANDGSTDDTAAVADAAARLEIVRVLHLPHSGANAARQAALEAVDTPYFAFVDADDALEPTFAEEMIEAAVRHKADLVFCPYICVYDRVERHVSYGGEGDAFARDAHPLRKTPNLLVSVPVFFWGKLFRTEYVRPHIDFAPKECAPMEDIPTIIPLLIDMPRMAKVATPLYRYAISSDSMCRVSKQELTRIVALRTLHERLEAIGALPTFLPQLYAINRCYLFDQLEKLRGYCDPAHQHRVIRDYFRHLEGTLPGWRPHPFHPTFYAAYWHGVVAWNTLRNRFTRRGKDGED
ncbi:MAG: glycosyltransferase, partial [Kiritimatiellae bacterium]|nr:glycosyltransferase [Kiritimatiellia bacterium]